MQMQAKQVFDCTICHQKANNIILTCEHSICISCFCNHYTANTVYCTICNHNIELNSATISSIIQYHQETNNPHASQPTCINTKPINNSGLPTPNAKPISEEIVNSVKEKMSNAIKQITDEIDALCKRETAIQRQNEIYQSVVENYNNSAELAFSIVMEKVEDKTRSQLCYHENLLTSFTDAIDEEIQKAKAQYNDIIDIQNSIQHILESNSQSKLLNFYSTQSTNIQRCIEENNQDIDTIRSADAVKSDMKSHYKALKEWVRKIINSMEQLKLQQIECKLEDD